VLELANVFRARVIDVAHDSLTIEITGTEDKIDSLLEVLRPLGLIEVVRTGQVAMRRGTKTTSAPAKESVAVVPDDDNVSYSV
jgi:acetolactate synthase-1/3 small subunit